MKWDDIGNLNCSIARSLALIGDRWTLLIIRNAFLGTRRFDDFQTQLGVTRHVLAERLKRLVEADILNKTAYQPNRYEYRLSKKGRALYPVLLTLTVWGDAWLDEGAGPPIIYHHKHCDKPMTPTIVCSECSEVVHPQDVIPMIGPGFLAPNDGALAKSGKN